jgi:peptidoglycan/xylan/chitin deacetylase (PgdA/CDA1 family)
MRIVSVAACLVSVALLAGCASKQAKVDPNVKNLSSPSKLSNTKQANAVRSFAPVKETKKPKVKFPETPSSSPLAKPSSGKLAGRTIYVNSISDIKLKPGEVVLTFDDGPVPGKTPAILNTLSNYGVKATFLMVGSMANYHPGLVKQVRARGHSIGSHTFDHANLAKVSFESGKSKIRAGEKALAKSGINAPFFRFPYLASTSALRKWLAQRGVTVLDVDIDSKDYFKDSADTIVKRTMARVKARGKGIILFHDIHARSVAALPAFLRELKAAGYKVVALKSNRRPSTGSSLQVSSLSE